MKRNVPILLAALLFAGGCVTTPPPTPYEAWQSELNEGQALTIRAAVLVAEVYNATYDHTIKEFRENPDLVAPLRDKINEARQLYRKAKSWNLAAMPPPPRRATHKLPNHWVLLAPNIPVEIDYGYSGSAADKYFFGLKVVTLRGKNVLSWWSRTEPSWSDPFGSYVDGDRVNLDVSDLLIRLNIDRE